MKKLFRHGDLGIKQISKLPKNLKKLNSNVLAEGEMTGHNHQLVAKRQDLIQLYEDADGNKYFEVKEDEAKLTHQEHKTITIEKGFYVVTKEREYDPFLKEVKSVQD